MIMATIVIYSTLTCPYCVNAKQLLESKGAKYTEVVLDNDPAKQKEMLTKTNGKRTVPQIFINGEHIGGFDDLKKLNESGKLDALLNKD